MKTIKIGLPIYLHMGISLLLFCLLHTAIAASAPYYHEFTINGYDRKVKIYPPTQSVSYAPVLFYFHGYSGTAEDSDSRRQFQNLWPEAIIAYAEGRRPYNANSELAGWRIRFPYISQVCGEREDLDYIDEVISHLRSNYAIDDNQVFASGHSSGAFFTLALMELKPDLFKGFAMLGAYSRFAVDASGVDCSDDVLWTRATQLDLDPTAHAQTSRPVLYMFGVLENFDYDGPNGRRSYSSSCNDTSQFRNTVHELLIRNRSMIPDCEKERDDYIKKISRQVFTPSTANGAETHIWLYSGGHGWEDFPDDANQIAVDFLKSLPPRWEVNNKGSNTYGRWNSVLNYGVPVWSNTVFADFDSDGRADAFERQSNGVWRVIYMSDTGFLSWQEVGSAGSTALAEMRFADFNADGKTDVYRRLSDGRWQINYKGSNNSGTRFGPWVDVGAVKSR